MEENEEGCMVTFRRLEAYPSGEAPNWKQDGHPTFRALLGLVNLGQD